MVLTIAIDSKENLIKTAGKFPDDSYKSNFELLSDPGHKIIDRYGLLKPNSRGIPHPATYIIDKKGIVRWKFVEVDYSKRPDNEQILEALKALEQ